MARSKRIRSKGRGSLYKRGGRGPWIATWHDHDGKRRERSTRTTDRAAAERILSKHVADAALRREGVVNARAESTSKNELAPVEIHLEAWESALRAKGNTAKRVSVVLRQVRRVFFDCNVKALRDIEAERVHRWIGTRREAGDAPRTINGHLQAVRQLIRWAVGEGRMASNPLAGVARVRVVGQTFERRPLEAQEVGYLIRCTAGRPPVRGMTGPDRAMLYWLAVGTGFRAGELASLMRASFDLEADPPAVTVRAAYSKRRRDDRQPIRPDLANALRGWLAGMPAGEPVFRLGDHSRLAGVLRTDLRAARARWILEARDPAERRSRRASGFLREQGSDGERVDFHALRATYITLLVKSGASVKEAQELARHSDPKLTMNVYTRLGVHDLAGALDRLPGLGEAGTTSAAKEQRATGTFDERGLRPADPQLYPRQLERRTAQDGATPGEGDRPLRLAGESPNPPRHAALCDPAPADAAQGRKATSGTRTPDLSFTKAPLYQLS